MPGKPSSVKPVLIWFSAGPCVLLLAVIEWMKHISSASSARCGSRSLIILPHWPRGLNSHSGRIRLPFSPWNVTSLSRPGIGCSCALDQLRLVVERVDVAERPGAEDHQHALGRAPQSAAGAARTGGPGRRRAQRRLGCASSSSRRAVPPGRRRPAPSGLLQEVAAIQQAVSGWRERMVVHRKTALLNRP